MTVVPQPTRFRQFLYQTVLVRIGAYYHDIGKVANPRFFGENQSGENPHDVLDPHESARIIIDHVINGEEMGKGMNLPQAILDFVTQHHGTQTVEFFYTKAVKNNSGGRVQKKDFQYPGPKPHSVEAAIVMICDAVEAASRSLEAPTRQAIENMVRFLLVKRINEGQFDECHLSTGCLAQILQTLVNSLEASFHSRAVYPWQEKKKEKIKVIAKAEGAIRKVIQEGRSTTFELNLPTPGGKTFEVHVVGILPSPEGKKTEGDEVQGAIAVFHDITRLKELERIREDFVANVSHELRTPLTTIKGYAETLLEGALKEEVASQFVQVIKRHTDRLTKIVEDLLTLSRIESREFELAMEPRALSDLIGEVLDVVREPAKKKRISLFYDKLASPLIARGDPHYLEQVFINLLDNAIKQRP